MEGSSRMGSTEEQTQPDMSLSLYNFSEDANESRSVGNCDDQESRALVVADEDERSPKRAKFSRHSTWQVAQLEKVFLDCQHPDETQRVELARMLGLEPRQVKFWFQNSRTQKKILHERKEKAALQKKYQRLMRETSAMREAMENLPCKGCGERSLLEKSMSVQEMKLENARLKNEILRVCNILETFIANRPSSETVNALSQLSLSLCASSSVRVGSACSSSSPFGVHSSQYQKAVYQHIAAAAMHEVVLLGKKDSPFWIKSLDGERETLDHDEYDKWFNQFGDNLEEKPTRLASEGTRAIGQASCTMMDLISTLMHPAQWSEMFPCMIGKVAIVEVLSTGEGTPDGELLMMNAELLFPSPLVETRHIRFLRYCKKQSDGKWAVADISIDPIREDYEDVTKRCRKLPSGCLVEELPNGHCNVTFVEHNEYDESIVHDLFRPLIKSGVCYGADRWLVTLQRQCECYALLASHHISRPMEFPIEITVEGRSSILQLMKRVVDNFCYGVCASTLQNWSTLPIQSISPETRVMTHVNVTDPQELSGIILGVSSCVWLPFPRERIFNFLSDPCLRPQWDLLSSDGPMWERVHINKCRAFSDAISILFPAPNPTRLVKTLVLQQTWADKMSSAVISTAAEISAITAMLSGEESLWVKPLASGFVIVDRVLEAEGEEPIHGSLMTLGFQILIDTTPTTMLTVESIETVTAIVDETVRMIRAALSAN